MGHTTDFSWLMLSADKNQLICCLCDISFG